jgi:RNA polymerase sigma factor (sigma-70 family)
MLDQSRPDFLDLLAENPDKAFREFYTFAYRLLKLKPPREMYRLSETDAEDVTHEVILHCVRDDFRVLKQYQYKGKPFVAWLYIVAQNKCLDFLRKRKTASDYVSSGSITEEIALDQSSSAADIIIEKQTDLKVALGITKKCLSKLGQYCQLLLQLAADEYMPREMVLILGWSDDKNKKVSDDLRDCRRRLRKLIVQSGINLESVLQD